MKGGGRGLSQNNILWEGTDMFILLLAYVAVRSCYMKARKGGRWCLPCEKIRDDLLSVWF